jgi:hypothetical protein
MDLLKSVLRLHKDAGWAIAGGSTVQWTTSGRAHLGTDRKADLGGLRLTLGRRGPREHDGVIEDGTAETSWDYGSRPQVQ